MKRTASSRCVFSAFFANHPNIGAPTYAGCSLFHFWDVTSLEQNFAVAKFAFVRLGKSLPSNHAGMSPRHQFRSLHGRMLAGHLLRLECGPQFAFLIARRQPGRSASCSLPLAAGLWIAVEVAS
ncbi:hypothetical protein [Devosia salina]|uniref:Uncharacterized protein n=1 Tax=Devosia salina TaxID=2860336 RepID=A0ABX8WK71_9HYPH|nr:hypothetical protein [Devosia salina]QYO78409.1 hypothetical protein K1X15_07640 [Devosia salina]